MPLLGNSPYVQILGFKRRGNGLLNNLVAYWKLDEASGNALDAHTNGLTLTATNAPGADTGKVYAIARTFNGSNQYFSRASDTYTQTGNIDFALACWLYFTARTGNVGVLGRWELNKYEYIIFYNHSTQQLQFYVSSNGTSGTFNNVAASNYGTVPTGQWLLVMIWHDSVNDLLGIQINNTTPNTVVHTAGVYVGTAAYRVGDADPLAGEVLNGRLGPVMLWKNRVLDASARAALWNGGNGLQYSAFTA